MINLYIENKSNLKKEILEKYTFFLVRKISGINSLVAFITNNNDDVYDNRLLVSNLLIKNNFIFSNNDDHYIDVIYSNNNETTNSNILEEIKECLLNSKIIPSIIEIRTYNQKNDNIVPTLSFEFHISNKYLNWLYNDISLETISKTQIDFINNNSQELKRDNSRFLGHTEVSVFGNDIHKNIEIMTELVKKCNNTSILNSLVLAQFIVETDYGRSELCKNASNCFGIKTLVPNSKWYGSVWDSSNFYVSKTKEQKLNGDYITIEANFRKYNSIEESIVDYLSYLLNATNGLKLRYEGIEKCKDYNEACHIIKKGHYATALEYEDLLIKCIKVFDLTKLDKEQV